ncbi:MAG: shikimate kinase [Deltaproteobacteria bacterium]|nr:MAG: shikimate kinase [Deltaproteobacteria bacterium]
MKKPIILTGFMGTGKTAVGEQLSQKLGCPFLDTDVMVEKATGKTIPEIFEKQGEPAFRELEKKMLKKALENEMIVISTGGGAVMDSDNRTLMKEKGFIIALSASPEVILERVSQVDNRPMLKMADKEGKKDQQEKLEKIKNLLSKRSPFYREANKIVDTTSKKIEETVAEILKIVS